MSFASGGLSSEKAPSLGLPFRYFVVSLIFLALFAVLLPFNAKLFLGSFLQPGLLALIHLLTLGWITTTILGAAFQLVPVALQVALHSERLANALLPPYLIGVVALIVGLWQFEVTLMIAASALLLLVALAYFYLMLRTLTRVRHWDVIAWHVAASVGLAALIPILGLLMALQNDYGILGVAFLPTLKTHLMLAMLGYVSLLIMGVSYKLVGMFTLAEDFLPERLAWIEFFLSLVGLAGLTVAFYAPAWRWIGWLGGIAFLTGVGLFVWIIASLYRQRRRRVFDINTPFTQTGTALFVAGLFMAGIGLTGWLSMSPLFWMAVGWVWTLGWIGQIIVGQMYKITPFLTWLHRYANRVGKEPVPGLDDLYNRPLALFSYGLWNLSVVGGAVAILGGWVQLMTIASAVLAAATAAFLINMLFIARR